MKMKKPILVVMAAGMGSRYGGLKQMDPVGSHGEVIMDYSLYDARRAGFEKVIFIITVCGQVIINDLKAGSSIIIICVDHSKWCINEISCCKNCIS